MNTPRRLPPLNALRAFEAASRHLNFRLAAEELGVTQGAVAQHVRGLEAYLGVRLFDRLPRALALTDQGRRYAGHLQQAFALMAEATGRLRAAKSRFTISVTPTFAAKWLLPRLADFAEEHPDIELRVLATEVPTNFESDGVDIALRQAKPPFSPGLAVDLLFSKELVAVCSPSLLANPPQPLTAETIDRQVLLSDGHDIWSDSIERALHQPQPPAARRVCLNQTAIEAAIAGEGIALADRVLISQDITARRLAQAFAPTMQGPLSFYVIGPRKPRNAKATARVRAWLLQLRD